MDETRKGVIPRGAEGLPVREALDELAASLEARGAAVLVAEPGAGKTTLVPLYLATGLYAGRGGILVLEPRRLAAVTAACRVASLLGEQPGETAGYRVRGDSRTSPATRVEFMTEGILVRMLAESPALEGDRRTAPAGLVVFDEFHERSARADLAFAFMEEARLLRPELGILVMSATMDAQKVAARLACPVVRCAGRGFPVEIRYEPGGGGRFGDGFARSVALAFGSTVGDVLAFLPGMGEIERTAAGLSAFGLDCVIEVLHGSISLEEQARIVSPPDRAAGTRGRRRIVLSTNIAETSVTVPGVTMVVDSGLARVQRFHPGTGMNRLLTERVSASEADQRAGRAGRLGPGTCVRCWEKAERIEPFRAPELSRVELSSVALECAVRGARRIEDVPWLDPPPASAWKLGVELLATLGLASGGNEPTQAGRDAARSGISPRVAAMVLRAGREEPDTLPLASLCAAIVERPDADDFGGDSDFVLRLDRALEGAPNARVRELRAEALRVAERAAAILGIRAVPDERAFLRAARDGTSEAGNILAFGFPDRIGRNDGEGIFTFQSGRRAKAWKGLERLPWIVAPDVDAGDALGSIRLAARIDEAHALAALEPSRKRQVAVSWKGLSPVATLRETAGALKLRETKGLPSPAEVLDACLSRIRSEGLPWLPWNAESRQLLARIRYAARTGTGEGAPEGAWDDASLAADAESWLLPFIETGGGGILDPAALEKALWFRAGIGRNQLERAAPGTFVTPGGRKRRVEYPDSGDAYIEIRIQELFGLAESPAIGGKPLVLRLLSPADRPLQTTSDLSGFWKRAYAEMRPLLRARYPRHYWPEDPLAAEPGKGLKPSARRSP